MPSFRVTILTPNGRAFDGQTRSLVAPGSLGYVGILAHHAPFMTSLGPGTITLRDEDGAVTTFTSTAGGYLEVSGNKAILLVDSLQIA